MTALNCIIGRAVHIATDAVCYLPHDQRLFAFCPKVATLPHLQAAIAMSGPAGLLRFVEPALYTEASDVDELIETRAVAAVAERVAAAGAPARVLIAGHSPRHGPAAWHLVGERFERVGGNAYLSPGVDVHGLTLAESDPAAFEGSIVRLVESQRRDYPVGGAVVLTTIRPAGIVQRVLHRWADRVGDVLGSSDAGGLRSATVDSGVSS